MSDLVIRLSSELASQRQQGRGRLAERLAETLAAFHARLSDSESGDTQAYRIVEGVDAARIDELRVVLAQLDGIESAFVKPAPEPP